MIKFDQVFQFVCTKICYQSKFSDTLKSTINLVFWHRYSNDHIYEEIPLQIQRPTNKGTGNSQSGDNNPELYSNVEEISPNERNTAYKEINNETDNLEHAQQGN